MLYVTWCSAKKLPCDVLYCIELQCVVLYCIVSNRIVLILSYRIVLYYVVLYYIVLYCLYYIVLYCIVCIVLYNIALYCIVLFVLYCIALYCIVLYCTYCICRRQHDITERIGTALRPKLSAHFRISTIGVFNKPLLLLLVKGILKCVSVPDVCPFPSSPYNINIKQVHWLWEYRNWSSAPNYLQDFKLCGVSWRKILPIWFKVNVWRQVMTV